MVTPDGRRRIVINQQAAGDRCCPSHQVDGRTLTLLADDHRYPTAFEHGLQLLAHQPKVHRDEHRPDAEAGQHGDQERGTVEAEIGDSVTVGDAPVGQGGAQAGGAAIELCVGEIASLVTDDDSIAIGSGMVCDGLGRIYVDDSA